MAEDSATKPQVNGRWSKDEHERFILGLQLYGKDWKKIEELIGTRTGSQIRSHAQKFLIKIKKETDVEEEVRDSHELSQLTQNSKVSEEELTEYSYFMGQIVKISHENRAFDFWESLIDQKSHQNNQDYENISRKNSFRALTDSDQEDDSEDLHSQPLKKIKL